eukprot:108420-Pyramimonas_sp.AAC.1
MFASRVQRRAPCCARAQAIPNDLIPQGNGWVVQNRPSASIGNTPGIGNSEEVSIRVVTRVRVPE